MGIILIFPFFPFAQCFLPVGLFSFVKCFLLAGRLIARFITCPFGFHRFNGSIIKYLNSATTHCLVEFFLTESLSRLIKVRDIKFKLRAQVVTYLFLSSPIACIFQTKQFGYLFDFISRIFVSSHSNV